MSRGSELSLNNLCGWFEEMQERELIETQREIRYLKDKLISHFNEKGFIDIDILKDILIEELNNYKNEKKFYSSDKSILAMLKHLEEYKEHQNEKKN